MVKVVVDAGHGGETDPGAVHEGRKEKDDNLALALAVGKILSQNGVDVTYTRTDDVYETPFQKAQKANQAGADFFISLHRNSSPEDNQYSGVESLVYDESGIKKEMAENINRELTKAGFKDLGIRERPGLVVLRRTKMPAVLVEVGFINTDADNETLDQNFNQVAQSIADGILMTLRENGMLPDGPKESSAAYRQADGRAVTEEDPLYQSVKETELPVHYRIQTGAFRREENARRLHLNLLDQGFPAEMGMSGDLHLVWVGEFENLDNAAKMEQVLRDYGYATYISTVQ